MTAQKEFWSKLSVFSPGNYIAVHISSVEGNYDIVNKKEFLDKFFDVVDRGFAFSPEFDIKSQYKGKNLQFLVRKVGRRQYEIDLTKVREMSEAHNEVAV